MKHVRFLVLVALGWLVATTSGWGLQTDNHGIHAVPTPGKVAVDGKLDDWDLSGRILICYDVASLKNIYSGRVAAMYDQDNLYLAVHWKDPHPMGNSHDPAFSANRGWAGDCLQLRVRTDMTMHIDAWYSAVSKAPVMSIVYGRYSKGTDKLEDSARFRPRRDALADGARMAFLPDEDGHGYVQEMALPWRLITGQGAIVDATGEPYKAPRAYVAGESLRCGIELLWGEADWPVHRYADNLADGTNSREFFWTAEKAWGEIKLSDKGRLELPPAPWDAAIAEARPQGPIAIAYTLPRDARVTIAVDDARGNRVRNLLAAGERQAGEQTDQWDGLDDRGDVVAPGTYTVKGLYHDGLSLTYEHSFASPGHPGWKTANDKGGFYSDHTAPVAAAAGPGIVALGCPTGEAGEHLIGVNARGQRQWSLKNRFFYGDCAIGLATDGTTLFIAAANEKDDHLMVWRALLKNGRYAPWRQQADDGKPLLDLRLLAENGPANFVGIAVHDGEVAVPLAALRRLLILDAETGKTIRQVDNLPAGMSACAYRADGALLVAAADIVYAVDTTTGTATPLVRGIEESLGIAVGPDGHIYVSQRGTRQNVGIYDAAGQAVGEIGKRGGRTERGRFDAAGMRDPAGIALDAQGRLWVTESTKQPKRTAVWTAAGELVLDLIGPTAYSAGGVINPYDHTRAFSEQVEYKLDYEQQTYTPIHTLPDAIGTQMATITKITRVNGREYAQAKSSSRAAAMVKLFLRHDDGAWQQVAEWGNVGQGDKPDDPRHVKWNELFAGPLWEGHFGDSFLWLDRNGDGVASRDEMQWETERRFGGCYWGQTMDDDLTVAMPVRNEGILIFKPTGFTAGGVPLYDLAKASPIVPEIREKNEGMIAMGRGGRIYLNQTPLTGIGPDGKVLWTYPSDYVSVHGSHHAPAPSPGLLIGPSSFYGRAFVNDAIGEVFYLNGNLGQNFIFTEDGLWVQSLYNDCRGWFDVPDSAVYGMPCDAMTAGGESFYGGFTRSDDGKYYTVGGSTSAVVMQVHGLDSLARFGGTVTVTAADVEAAQQLKVELAAKAMAPKTYTIGRVATPPPTDGSLDAWEMARNALQLQRGREDVGTVKAVYDDRHLYVAYRVADRRAPLRNVGQDDRLMFITGDCVDLMLRTDPAAKGKQPVAGDLRLLFTIKDGQPLAVVYRPVVPGTAKDARVSLSSNWRAAWFDQVAVVELPLALTKEQGGYTVTAAVPWSVLGATPAAGTVWRGDFGILGSDSAGQETTSRDYWSNKTTNNTNDVPDEAYLTPALWGELRFE